MVNIRNLYGRYVILISVHILEILGRVQKKLFRRRLYGKRGWDLTHFTRHEGYKGHARGITVNSVGQHQRIKFKEDGTGWFDTLGTSVLVRK